jgi:hypothetical protein
VSDFVTDGVWLLVVEALMIYGDQSACTIPHPWASSFAFGAHRFDFNTCSAILHENHNTVSPHEGVLRYDCIIVSIILVQTFHVIDTIRMIQLIT